MDLHCVRHVLQEREKEREEQDSQLYPGGWNDSGLDSPTQLGSFSSSERQHLTHTNGTHADTMATDKNAS